MKITKLNSLKLLGAVQMRDMDDDLEKEFGIAGNAWGSPEADQLARTTSPNVANHLKRIEESYKANPTVGKTYQERLKEAMNETKTKNSERFPGQAEAWNPAEDHDMPLVPDYKRAMEAAKAKEKEEKKKLTVATVPIEAQMTFWNYLNDVKYVDFKPEELTKANTWLITKTATYLIQKNGAGYFGTKKSDEGIPTLPASKHEEVFFELTYGPIPNGILEQIVAFFREVMKRHHDAEAFIQVYWDKTEEKYVVHVPKQRINKASVVYDATENLNAKDPSRYVFVYECHSHNSMDAFWSNVDDNDEKELRIYGVFGELNRNDYKCLHRFFVGEEQIDLEPCHVFEGIEEKKKTYLVTHDKKQYLVPEEKLILDQKPRFIFTNDQNQKAYIPVENVVLHRAKVDFPEGWFGSINVPLPAVITHTSNFGKHSQTYTPNYPKKDKHNKAQSYDRKAFLDNYDPADYMSEATNAAFEETAYEISVAVSDLYDLTNGFVDVGTTLAFIEELESSQCLYTLHRHMSDYIGSGEADLALP